MRLFKALVFLCSALTALPVAMARMKSSALAAIGQEPVSDFVRRTTRRLLKGRSVVGAGAIATEILTEGLALHFDPVLLVALIENESNFSPRMRGTHGEIGLMQIKPSTGRWIAHQNHLPWHGVSTLEDPVQNIRLGSLFLAQLREQFTSHRQLYLAAYNMGAHKVRRAVEKGIYPRDYPARVQSHYQVLLGQRI